MNSKMHRRKMRSLTSSNENLKKELQEARNRLRQRKHSGVQHSTWMALAAEHPKEEEETWFATYLDMMTLLLVLMLVMLAFAGAQEAGHGQPDNSAVSTNALQLTPDKSILLGTSLLPENTAIWQGFDFSVLGDEVDVLQVEDSVKLRINSEILFPSGKSDLSLAGLGILKKLLPIFKQDEVYITVAGHTDNIPIRSHRYPSNWELSSARAGSVVRYLESNGTSSKRLRAVGYADVQPISSNDSEQGRALNRRVEFDISPHPFPESGQFRQ
ncbi:MAG TPA: OmpA family protein [Paenalcaligenes sp.]|nr:OmpA family protein [Paenalcaligenes sp.]